MAGSFSLNTQHVCMNVHFSQKTNFCGHSVACCGKWSYRYALNALKYKRVPSHASNDKLAPRGLWQRSSRHSESIFLIAGQQVVPLSLWNIKHPRLVNDVRNELTLRGPVIGRNSIQMVVHFSQTLSHPSTHGEQWWWCNRGRKGRVISVVPGGH